MQEATQTLLETQDPYAPRIARPESSVSESVVFNVNDPWIEDDDSLLITRYGSDELNAARGSGLH